MPDKILRDWYKSVMHSLRVSRKIYKLLLSPKTRMDSTHDLLFGSFLFPSSSSCLSGSRGFQNLVNDFSQVIDKLAISVENSKIRAIGSRNALNSVNKEKAARRQQLKAMIAEKTQELERLKVYHESLVKRETEFNDLIDNVNHFRMWYLCFLFLYCKFLSESRLLLSHLFV